MTPRVFTSLPLAVTIAAATLVSVGVATPASAKKIDCERLAAIMQREEVAAAGYRQDMRNDVRMREELRTDARARRKIKNAANLRDVWARNCGGATEAAERDRQGEIAMQVLLGAAIGLGGQYLGGGSRGYGHGSRNAGHSHPTGARSTTGSGGGSCAGGSCRRF